MVMSTRSPGGGAISGIVGDRAGRAVVQSPIKKQAFAFDDGVCLDSDGVCVAVYETHVSEDGVVHVGR